MLTWVKPTWMILSSFSEADLKYVALYLCKDRCLRPWSRNELHRPWHIVSPVSCKKESPKLKSYWTLESGLTLTWVKNLIYLNWPSSRTSPTYSMMNDSGSMSALARSPKPKKTSFWVTFSINTFFCFCLPLPNVLNTSTGEFWNFWNRLLLQLLPREQFFPHSMKRSLFRQSSPHP